MVCWSEQSRFVGWGREDEMVLLAIGLDTAQIVWYRLVYRLLLLLHGAVALVLGCYACRPRLCPWIVHRTGQQYDFQLMHDVSVTTCLLMLYALQCILSCRNITNESYGSHSLHPHRPQLLMST